MPRTSILYRTFHRAVGIVGMPNVGKSTLFNALTRSEQAQAANYPFCTIDPNIAKVAVPDERLGTLASLVGSKKIIESQIEFVDIAGLVRGASQGEGLGNQFLENIRQVSVLAHVIRCFEDEDIIHVENTVDPVRDCVTIESELILSDLMRLEKHLATIKKKAKNVKTSSVEIPFLERLVPWLEEGHPASKFAIEAEGEEKVMTALQLLSSKPMMYLCNVSEDDASTGNAHTKEVEGHVGQSCLIVSGALEEAAAAFEDSASQMEYLACCGLEETGLTQVLRASRELLHLQTFYTVGPQEARAWHIQKGATAPQAAGVIHSDFEQSFIRAETIAFDDFIETGSEAAARSNGLLRAEGKEYQCKDGDVFHFLTGK